MKINWVNITVEAQSISDDKIAEAWIAEWDDEDGNTDGSFPMFGDLEECKAKFAQEYPEIAA